MVVDSKIVFCVQSYYYYPIVMLFTTNPYGTLFVGFSSGVESGEWGRFGELELKLLKKERTGKRKKERDVNDPL